MTLPQARAYSDFKVGELFSIETPKWRFNANVVKFGGVHPYVVRTSQNNGRRGTIVADEKWLNPGKTISFGQDTATIFYQPKPYFTGDKIKILSFVKGTLNERIACYLLTVMRKAFSNFTWGTSSFNENVLKAVVVSLPVVEKSSRQLDLAYMDAYIRELESARIRELDKWLVVSGLDDYELKPDEQKAIDDWRAGRIRQKVVKVRDLFSVETPKRRFNANAVKFGGTHPYVVRTSQNNGRRKTIIADEEWLNKGNTISFGQDTATIFYQDEPYFTGDKIKVMDFLHGELDDRVACWLLTVMRKAFSNFTWGSSSFNEKVLKNVEVNIPVTDSNTIDLAFMSLFVRATIKQMIRGVVEWKDREIAATRKASAPPSHNTSATDVPEGEFTVREEEEFLETAGLPSHKADDEYSMPPKETLS